MTTEHLEPTIAGQHAHWTWRPDAQTTRAINRGNRKIAKAKRLLLQQMDEDTTMATRKTTTAKKAPVKNDMVKKALTDAKKTKATIARARKDTPAKKAAPAKKAPVAKSNLTPLKTIVPDGMDTRIARRKLRKAGLAGHDAKARWEFTAAEVKKVQEILAA